MSNSIPEATTCPLGNYCPRQPSEPGTAHPPPDDWRLEIGKNLQKLAADGGAFEQMANGDYLVGLYLSPAGGPVFVCKDKDGRVSQYIVSE